MLLPRRGCIVNSDWQSPPRIVPTYLMIGFEMEEVLQDIRKILLNDFKVFTSSLGISRWKNMDQINDSGRRAASNYPDIIYWTYNWRKATVYLGAQVPSEHKIFFPKFLTFVFFT